MTEPREKTPAEFTKDMDEGEGAGPGAPETDSPRTGRPGAGGGGPKGPGGAGPEKPSAPDRPERRPAEDPAEEGSA